MCGIYGIFVSKNHRLTRTRININLKMNFFFVLFSSNFISDFVFIYSILSLQKCLQNFL